MSVRVVLTLIYVGLNFKLDIGLYRLDQQVACQRYRQNLSIAEAKETRDQLIRDVANLFAPTKSEVALAA